MLAHRLEGRGEKVLFLHGFLESKEMFDSLGLSTYFQCLSVDLPGHGESTDVNYPRSIADMATEVQIVLNHHGWVDFHIVGHSMGGYVALELAQIVECKRLFLFHSNFWTDSEQKKKDRARVASLALKNARLFVREAFPSLFLPSYKNHEFVQKSLEIALKMKPEAISNSSLAMAQRKDFSQWVLLNKDLVHVISGELDPIFPIQEVVIKCELLPNFYVLENCGHMGHLEAPASVTAILVEKIRAKF